VYTLFASSTINSKKVLYVLEEIGASYQTRYVNVFKQENQSEEIRALAPFAKIPVLKYEDQGIFESAAICRLIASTEQSPLYPKEPLKRAGVDQWIDFFNCHLGRWIGSLYFQHIIKPKIGQDPDPAACEEPLHYANQQLEVLDRWLGQNRWLAGFDLSIADFYAFAYIEYADRVGLDLAKYPEVRRWRDAIAGREAIRRAGELLNKAA